MPSNLHQLTTKIVSLSRSGFITTARKLFDQMPHKDSITWNAMLSSYSQLGLHRDALSLFHLMRFANAKPDHFTFTSTLNACSGFASIRDGTKAHALIIVFGYQSYLPVNNSLVDMYGKCLDPASARKVFQEMGQSLRNEVTWCSLIFAHVNSGQFNIAFKTFNAMPVKVLVAWNIMISGFARYGEVEMCINLLKEMRESLCCTPDHWTFSSLMNACTESSDYAYGHAVHGFIVRTGWSSAVEVKNSILSFYAKLGCMDIAIKEFESIGLLSQVSWNAMLDGYLKMGNTFEAFNVFQRIRKKNVISWTSMIAGYARNGNGEQALKLFVQMVRSCVCPDDFTFGAILHACSSLAVLGFGKMVHGCVIRYGFQAYVYVGNGLVNMYAKCGDIKGSSYAFDEILEKDLVSWNAMLFGFGMHGLSTQALQVYDDMVAHGMIPDKVSFIGLLMTCSHAGLINKGRFCFDLMDSVYGLTYEIDHVACMVDMLGRGGYLAEAKELASKYVEKDSVEAKSSSYEALLGACSIYGDVRMGVSVGDEFRYSLNSRKDTGYVLLSNLYCTSGQWKKAEIVRRAMVDQGIKKMPGYSWIEVKNKMDKASIIGDGVLCVQDLQMQAKKLKAEIAGLEATLAGSERYQESVDNPVKFAVARNNSHPICQKIMQLEFQVEERGFYVRLICRKYEGVAISLYNLQSPLSPSPTSNFQFGHCFGQICINIYPKYCPRRSTAKAVEWDAARKSKLDPSGRIALGVHLSAYDAKTPLRNMPSKVIPQMIQVPGLGHS